MKVKKCAPLVFLLLLFIVAGCATDDRKGNAASVPRDIVDPPNAMPFSIERDQVGEAPTEEEIDLFTRKMKDFYEGVDLIRWAQWHSFGASEDNPDGDPPYMIWWQCAHASKAGDTITFSFDCRPDNTMAATARFLPGVIALYLANGDEDARRLAQGYIRGLSATYDGMVWAGEEPTIDYLMARTIFYRNHAYAIEPGRNVQVDYDAARIEEVARRHDNWHNPDNPTWGDIYVRNKRSKDDLPFLYRNLPNLARIIRESDDAELVDASITLYRHIVRMCRDIVDKGYKIYSKGENGEVFLPRINFAMVDDFASFTCYDLLLPEGECTAKASSAYIGYGDAMGNECGDGINPLYELVFLLSHYWGTNIYYGFHVSALSLALTFDDQDAARGLLEGLAARMGRIMCHPLAPDYSAWYPDFAALLVLAAANGLPLTNEEAQLVMEHYADAADHYSTFEYWDLWDPSIPDGDYQYVPDRDEHDAKGAVVKTHVRLTEIAHLFEYCYSPLKDPEGAQFVDCETLMGSRLDHRLSIRKGSEGREGRNG